MSWNCNLLLWAQSSYTFTHILDCVWAMQRKKLCVCIWFGLHVYRRKERKQKAFFTSSRPRWTSNESDSFHQLNGIVCVCLFIRWMRKMINKILQQYVICWLANWFAGGRMSARYILVRCTLYVYMPKLANKMESFRKLCVCLLLNYINGSEHIVTSHRYIAHSLYTNRTRIWLLSTILIWTQNRRKIFAYTCSGVVGGEEGEI